MVQTFPAVGQTSAVFALRSTPPSPFEFALVCPRCHGANVSLAGRQVCWLQYSRYGGCLPSGSALRSPYTDAGISLLGFLIRNRNVGDNLFGDNSHHPSMTIPEPEVGVDDLENFVEKTRHSARAAFIAWSHHTFRRLRHRETRRVRR